MLVYQVYKTTNDVRYILCFLLLPARLTYVMALPYRTFTQTFRNLRFERKVYCMENIIKLLPEFLANQIAAGEVVQRPESVVKELVENAIDAGADSIAVVVQNAGKTLIHVIDNGKGISQFDLPMALKRHATSKIATVEDLHKIMTLGFRGEALASIAAVAMVEIRSKTDDVSTGYRLLSEPLKEERIEPFQTDKGSQVIVKNLFYNVPARKKFLRSDLTEFRHISETMVKFALSRPEIRFTFTDNKTVIFDVKKQTLLERVRAMCGDTIADNVHVLEYKNNDIELSGYVGSPSTASHARGNQYLFLNNRAIVSRSLNFAINQVYEPYIDKNTYPFFIVHIRVNPETVDVNVHPQKHEVKFDNERHIFSILQEATLRALNTAHSIPNIHQHPAIVTQPFTSFDNNNFVNRVTGEIIPTQPKSGGSSFQSPRTHSDFNQRDTTNVPRSFTPQDLSAYEALFGKNSTIENNNETLFAMDEESRNVWQIHNSYIVYQTQNGLNIIDQYNAHVRLLFDSLLSNGSNDYGSQELLFSVEIPLNNMEISVIQEFGDDVQSVGYNYTVEGSLLKLTAVPQAVASGNEENSLKKLLASLYEDNSSAEFDKKRKVALAFARSNAVQSGKKLSKEEMISIINRVEELGKNPLSPTGNPITITVSIDELMKTFRT